MMLIVDDAKTQPTAYSYDVMDRLATRIDALTRQETYQYDPAGNLTQFLDRKGQASTFTYDALNRRASAQYADGSTVTFTYDAVGRLTRVSDAAPGAGSIDFYYDLLDRLILEVTPQGAGAYTYDALGRRTTMTVAGQAPVTYQYDADSRLTQVAQGSLTVSLGYDAAGRRTLLTYPNGVTTTYTYDNANRVTRILHQGPSGVIEDLQYTYDAAGNRTSLSRANGTASLLPAVVASATYDAANEQTQFGTATLTYDANGNLTSDGTSTYTWDARNRLIGISGGVSAAFSYDALGRRISKAINGVTTSFLYDGNDIVQELNGGAVGASYLRSLNIDKPFVRQTGTGEFYHTDALGSTLVLSNASGAPATTYSYEAFGNTTSSGTSTNPFQYTGRENDGTGLYYYRARYYSTFISRFISEDPVEFAGGDINLFNYSQNNPINLSDPGGLLVVGGPIPPACEPPLDKQEKYLNRLARGFLCSLNFLPAVGGINITGKALKHVVERHVQGGTGTAGKSLFGQGENISELVRKAESVAPVPQTNGNFQRVINVGRTVGTDVTTGQPTSIYTVITDAADNLITAFPGKPVGRP